MTFINIECEISKTIREKRLEQGITPQMANDRRNWDKRIREYEKRKSDKYYEMALYGPLFSS